MGLEALGAGIGGLLGGMDASSGPAGNTTSYKTQVDDVPDWLRPYITSGLSGASDLFSNLKKAGSDPLLGLSHDELESVISGKYLSPDSNPYLAATGRRLADEIGRSVDSRFSSAGRYGSGAFQDTLGHSVGDALTALYGQAYNQERARQYGAAVGAPAYVSSSVGAEFAPYADFLKLMPNLKSSSGTLTEPYFRNKGAGILGGALAGSQLGRMFGGGSGTAPTSGGSQPYDWGSGWETGYDTGGFAF